MSNTKKADASPVDVDALLAGAKLPERTVDVCLRGDLHARFQELDAELGNVMLDSTFTLTGADNSRVTEIHEEIRAIQEEMRAATLTLHVRAISKARFDQIVLDYPVGDKDGDADRAAGFDQDAVNAALIRACVFDPELTDERWARLSEAMTTHQYREVMEAVNMLNFNPVDVPFSRTASARSPVSSES